MVGVTVTEIALRVGASLACGALVGLERERRRRAAGLRTMMLICLGSCAFVLVGVGATGHVAAQTAPPPGAPAQGQAEISRVLQGLIGGIGFLGAGTVIQGKGAVRGLTSAAAVWVVAALGAACGLGFYALAAVLAACTLLTLTALKWVERRLLPGGGHGGGRAPRPGVHAPDGVAADADAEPPRRRAPAAGDAARR